jgi:hypothetical protein
VKLSGGTLIAAAVVLGFGGLMIYGGFSKYADQHSGVAGKATVTHCSRGFNTKYVHEPSRCTGRWEVGGDPIFGNGKFGIGRIEGASARDVGKDIDVRIHGTDHATVPNIKDAIMLWVLGGGVALFGLVVLRGAWTRSPST